MLDLSLVIAGVGGTILIGVLGYSCFWAFNIRRGLVVPLYRRQALGIGLVSVGIAYFTFFLLSNFSGAVLPTSGIAGDIAFELVLWSLIPLFYWTDVSMLAARESDPLDRDHFRWSQLRRVLWGIYLAALLTQFAAVWLSALFPDNLFWASPPFALTFFAVVIPAALPLVLAGFILPLGARRSSDLTLRTHLRWFGIGAALIVLSFAQLIVTYALVQAYFPSLLTSGGGSPLAALVLYVLLVAAGYCLYRSARAIVPLYGFADVGQS